MPSRALAVALVSTARLETTLPANDNGSDLAEVKAQRLCTLGLHLLADLNGLEHSNDPESFLFELQETEDLDHMVRYTQDDQERLAKTFAQVADLRLEEQHQLRPFGILGFYLKAIWHLRGDISSAVKPGQALGISTSLESSQHSCHVCFADINHHGRSVGSGHESGLSRYASVIPISFARYQSIYR
jgi:hypothetical protein